MEDLVARTSLIIAFYGVRTQHACSDSEHEDLIEALAARSAARAGELMERNLHHIEAELDIREAVETPLDIRKVLSG